MKNNIYIYFVTFTFLTLQSCKFDNAKNEGFIPNDVQKQDTTKLTLSQMENQNGALIDSVEKRVLKQVKQRDFMRMFNEADTSLINEITATDMKSYFKMIDNFYGKLNTLKVYGTSSTEKGKILNYIANYSSGDSLELTYTLLYYKHDVKLSYISMNRFQKDTIPASILKIFKPKIKNIFKRDVTLVYNDCSSMFKSKITREKITTLLNKDFKSSNDSYEIMDCKPLIFGKGEVGFLIKTQKVLKDGTTKKIKIPFFLDENGAFKIADIQISK